MKLRCIVAISSFYFVAGMGNAASVTLTGEHVRFIFDESLSTAFGGQSPVVQGDKLLFTPSDAFTAHALAPAIPVGFKEQNIEFKVEALGGYKLTAVNVQASGVLNATGNALLTGGLVYGRLNVKDSALINHTLNYESLPVSSTGWDAFDVSQDAKGQSVTVSSLATHTVDIAASHAMRAYALDTTGETTMDTRNGVGFSVSTTAVEPWDRVFDWAESYYSSLTLGTETRLLSDGLHYRCYPKSGVCIGIKNTDAYTYSYQDNVIRNIGSVLPYYELAEKAGY